MSSEPPPDKEFPSAPVTLGLRTELLRRRLENEVFSFRRESADRLARQRMEQELSREKDRAQTLSADLESEKRKSEERKEEYRHMKEAFERDVGALAQRCRILEEENAAQALRLKLMQEQWRESEAQRFQQESKIENLAKKVDDLKSLPRPSESPSIAGTRLQDHAPLSSPSLSIPELPPEAPSFWKRIWDWWNEPVTVISFSGAPDLSREDRPGSRFR